MVAIRIEAKRAYEVYRRPGPERRLPPHEEDAARWGEFCASIEDRILAVRAEAADPFCGACGSSTPEVREQKWCPRCQSSLTVARFSRDRARSDGLHPICKGCESVRGKQYRTKAALDGARRTA